MWLNCVNNRDRVKAEIKGRNKCLLKFPQVLKKRKTKCYKSIKEDTGLKANYYKRMK